MVELWFRCTTGQVSLHQSLGNSQRSRSLIISMWCPVSQVLLPPRSTATLWGRSTTFWRMVLSWIRMRCLQRLYPRVCHFSGSGTSMIRSESSALSLIKTLRVQSHLLHGQTVDSHLQSHQVPPLPAIHPLPRGPDAVDSVANLVTTRGAVLWTLLPARHLCYPHTPVLLRATH